MTRPILVFGLADARVAMAAAAALSTPVTLISAPGAGAHGGAGWFRSLLAIARADYPQAAVTAVLDCAALPGAIQAGIRAGISDLRFTGDAETAARLAAIANAAGARLHGAESFLGPHLDLRGSGAPEAACRDWLTRDSPPDSPS